MNELYRSSDEKVIAGVCSGLAHRFNLNATGLRWLVAIVSIFFTGIPAVVYLVLWCILKERSTSGSGNS